MSEVSRLASDWYRHNARDLPWRRPDTTPWGVLVSEIMLQQTPVSRGRVWAKGGGLARGPPRPPSRGGMVQGNQAARHPGGPGRAGLAAMAGALARPRGAGGGRAGGRHPDVGAARLPPPRAAAAR